MTAAATRAVHDVAGELAELADIRAALGPAAVAELLRRHRASVATRTVGAALTARGALVGTVVTDRDGQRWTKTDAPPCEAWTRRDAEQGLVVISLMTMTDTTSDRYAGPYVITSVPTGVRS